MKRHAGARRARKKPITSQAMENGHEGLRPEVHSLAGGEATMMTPALQLRRWQETLGNRATQQLVQRQMGQPAIVAEGQARRSPASSLRPNGGSRMVIQRVLSQFQLDKERKTEGNDQNITITDVLIAGRTPSPFSGTMGAHSTAWVAHIDAVRRQMIGYHLDEVCTFITNFAQEQRTSPLLRLKGVLDQSHIEKLNNADVALGTAIDQIQPFRDENNIANSQLVVAGLQKLLNALLTFVNYLPMATVDGGNPGGNGEGAARSLLNLHESAGSAKDFIDGANEDKNGELMSGSPSQEKLNQYDQTISGYEQQLKDLKKEDKVVDLSNQEKLKAKVQEQLRKMFAAETPGVFAQTRVQNKDPQLICEIWALGLQHYLETVKSAYPYSYTLAGWNDEDQLDIELGLLLGRQAQANEVIEEFKLSKGGDVRQYIRELLRGQREFAKLGEDGKAPLKDVLEKKAEMSAAGIGPSDYVSESKGTFMSSIFLDEDGKVGDVFIHGRTPKPFSSREGMGAHSTAWTAHVDAVRSAMSGKSLKKAGAALESLAYDAFSSPAYTQLKDQVGGKQAHMLEQAAAILKHLLDQDIDYSDVSGAMGQLEYMIYAYLDFVNVTPLGTVLTGGVPGGRSEGQHRKLLQNFEENEPNVTPQLKTSLREALFGLFDPNAIDKFTPDEDKKGGHVNDLETKKWLYSLSSLMHTLETAYPKAYAVADFQDYVLEQLNAPVEEDMGQNFDEESSEDKDVKLNELDNKGDIALALQARLWKLGQKVQVAVPFEGHNIGYISGRFNESSFTVKVQFIKGEVPHNIQGLIGIQEYPIHQVTPI